MAAPPFAPLRGEPPLTTVSRSRRLGSLLLAAAGILAVVGALYGRVLGLWWNHDDLYLVHLVASHSPAEYFFSPALCRGLPHKTFFPLLLASYRLDLALFGASPAAFYAHELLAIAAALGAFFLALRQWVSPPYAAAGTLLFALGTPAVLWAQQAMHRHYIEGFALAALSGVLYVDALRRGRSSRAFVSAALYLLAMLAKEVYAPLPVLLLLVPERTLAARVRALRAHAAAFALYAIWRTASLGTAVGGYGWAAPVRELPRLLAGLPVRVVASLFSGGPLVAGLLAGLLLLGVGYRVRRSPRTLAFVGVGALLALAPAAAVARTADARFATPLWALAAATFAAGAERLAVTSASNRRAAAALVGAAALAAFFSNRAAWERGADRVDRMGAEGRAFLLLSPADLLRRPSIPPAAMEETRWFKEEYLRRPRGTEWFADDVFLCGRAATGRIWEFDGGEGRVADVTHAVRAALPSYCAGWRREAPLSADFERRGGAVFWRLGPYADGRWEFLFGGGRSAAPVEPAAGYRFAASRVALMVRYQAPSGWLTYSPELVLDFRTGNRFRWTRAHEPQ